MVDWSKYDTQKPAQEASGVSSFGAPGTLEAEPDDYDVEVRKPGTEPDDT